LFKKKTMDILTGRLSLIGRLFFAFGVAGIAIEHFIFGDFVMGRAPQWPESLPMGFIWAYFTGTLFILVSILIIIGKRVREASLIAALLVFVWAFLRYIPILFSDPFLSPTWTSAGKALVFTGGFLAVAGTLTKMSSSANSPFVRFVNSGRGFVLTGRVCLGLFLMMTGVQHFMFVEFVASLIPPWFPGDAVFWTYFAGVALILGGLGLLVPRTASMAALLSGLMIFSWFWIVHIPRTMESLSDNIAVFEALAFSGLAFVMVGLPPDNQ
jgi:uncharacterized membrane protein